MASAAERTFAVPELLEHILFCLHDTAVRGDDWTSPITDLFTCLRVDKTFKAAIENSKKLKRVMLLEHDAADPEGKAGIEFFNEAPMFGKKFHPAVPYLRPDPDGRLHESPFDKARMAKQATLDLEEWGYPNLCAHPHGFEFEGRECTVPHPSDRVYTKEDGMEARRDSSALAWNVFNDKYAHAAASWQKMKLCKADHDVAVEIKHHLRTGPFNLYWTSAFLEASDMGHLWKVLKAMLAQTDDDFIGREEDNDAMGWMFIRALQQDAPDDDVFALREAKRAHDKLADCGRSMGNCPYYLYVWENVVYEGNGKELASFIEAMKAED